MDFRFTPEQERFRQDVRRFLAQEWPPERELLTGRSAAAEDYRFEEEFRRKLGAKGWLALDWPPQYGGGGRPFLERYILSWEVWYHGATYSLTAVHIVAPVLLRHGSANQKQQFLPRIASGEIDFALGFSEAGAGSDLASLQTEARRQGDCYVIRGQKVYTSFAHLTQFIWLAARTDPEAPKHRGISLFIVPTDAPGLSITPLLAMDGERTNITFYDSVRVPKQMLVGEENMGWYYLGESLDYERVALFPVARLKRIFDRLAEHVRANKTLGVRREIARLWLAEAAVELEVATLLSHRTAWLMDRGQRLDYESAATKVYITELYQRLANGALHLLGLWGQTRQDSPLAVLKGDLEKLYRFAVMQTFGGGASEVLRDRVAARGLGLPRPGH